MVSRPIISIVDDDESVRESTSDLIESLGFITRKFPHAEGFLQSKIGRRTACLIVDVRMPGMTGIELHEHLVGSGQAIPTILMTALPNDRDRAHAMRSGVTCYLSKPFGLNQLLAGIHAALETDAAHPRNLWSPVHVR
jgi:FixJ family two-component response regulator